MANEKQGEARFTPGPWVVEGAASATVAARHDGVAEIAEVVATGSMTHAERRANAALIAAAPKMYAALKAYESLTDRGTLHTTDEEWDEARGLLVDALGQAEGR